MLPPADRDIVARDPGLPGLALVLDAQAVSDLLGAPAQPVHLRYKPGVSCMATFRVGGDFVTLRALTRARFDADEIGPRRAALVRLLPQHAVIVLPPAADRRITALRKGVVPGDAMALRFKPERRLVLRRDKAMIKAMSRATWDRALQGARFGASMGGPAVLAVDEGHRLITTAWLQGTSAEAAPPATFARIGAALAALHRAKADLPRRAPSAPPAALADLERLAPHLSARIVQLRRSLALMLQDGAPVPCHGDFSADQVMLAPDGRLSFVDWDEACLTDPARDLGSFLARLDHDRLTGTATAGWAGDSASAFLQGYGSLPPHLPAHHASALAALATEGFRTRRPDWPDLARRLLDRAADILPPPDPLRIAADPAAMARLTGLAMDTATMIRLKPGKRALFDYDARLIGKLRLKGPDLRTPALHDRLRAAGLDGSDGTGVPAARGSVPALHLWLQDRVPGQVLTGLIALDGPTAPLYQTGRGLARLHGTDVGADRSWTMQDEVDVLQKALAPQMRNPGIPRFDIVAPDTPAPDIPASDILALLGHLSDAALALPAGPATGIHRDFYPDQVLIDGGRVWLLDLDLYAQGDPAVDLGNFLAHLDEFALRKGWAPAALKGQQDAFLAGYGSLRPVPGHVGLLRALSLARHIGMAARFADRRHTPRLIIAHLNAGLGAALTRNG